MKTSRIVIKNLYGIREQTLDGSSVELTGPKGSGKTSVLDAIRYALTNRSNRDYVIRRGAEEGEILIETEDGLSIDRRKGTEKADAVKVQRNGMIQTRPAEFLAGIFTPLQLNPVEFTQMSRQEKNRTILSLIDFGWDTNWIMQQFGEIPQGVDYSRHILEVLSDIQSENGSYFQSRQALNRDIRNKLAFIADIQKTLPENYDAAKWEVYSLGDAYRELDRRRENNAAIERAKTFRDGYDDRARGIRGMRDMAEAAAQKGISEEKIRLRAEIARLRAEIAADESTILTLDERLREKTATIDAEYKVNLANLERDAGAAAASADRLPQPTGELESEIKTAEAMRRHLNEYRRLESMQKDVEELQKQSDELTRKIELARELPARILEEAVIPIEGLTVENGIPLIHGLPVSNLSDGELLELCVDVTVSRPGQLQIILIDGAEKLDTASREKLYARCREKGLQLIATRVTDSPELEIVCLD